MSRHLDAWYLGRRTKCGRLSLVVGEGKQRPVKVIHKFYDTYSKLMNLTCGRPPVVALEWIVDTQVLRHEKRMPKDPSRHARSEFLRESLTFAFSRLARR